MHIDRWWAPFVLLGGATQSNSFVELTPDSLNLRFGMIFHDEIPRVEIESADIRAWPLLYGIGWRVGPMGGLGLIGSYQGVVEIKLRSRHRAWEIVPYNRIAVSLENPDAFIAAVTGGERSPPIEGPSTGPSPRRSGTRHRGPVRRTRGLSQE